VKKERLITGVILVFLIGIVFQHEKYTSSINYYVNTQLDLEDNILGLVDHPPIVIDDNADFETLNFTGDGTEIDPYLITNLFINASGATWGIIIHVTSVHYEIRNCTILTDYIGIDLSENAANTAKINNNTIISKSGDGGGIVLTSTFGVTITDNECAYFMQGIHLNHAHNNIILNNMILSSNYQGINIRNSNYNELTYNTIENSQQHGLAMVGYAHTNVIHHNTFINNSKAETYTIDGERTGIIMSQGYDEGSSNTWYDEGGKHGNRWSDLEGRKTYPIDGPANAEDIYPLELTYNESAFVSLVTFLLSFTGINCLLIVLTKRRK